MLCLQRGTLIYNRSIQEDKVWDCTVVQHQQRVEGQTMGIVGLGRIGRHVARIAGKGLGMKILAYDPFLPPEIAEAAGATLVDLDTIFAESDVISIHMNLTEDNVHMFDREAFSKMKKKPFIINEGRGPMISEEALAWALDTGLVRGAGLDMLESEFPDAEYLSKCPLLGRDNVIITPHSAFYSTTAIEDLERLSCENIVHFLKGEKEKVFKLVNEV